MMLRGLFILNNFSLIYGMELKGAMERYVEFVDHPHNRRSIEKKPHLLSEVEAIFSGWGAPVFDRDFLKQAPRLEVVFYGAGSIRGCVTDAFWERGIRITHAAEANAIPVAEFTLAQILFSLKKGWHYILRGREQKGDLETIEVPGAYGTTVGIIALGRIGRRVCRLLDSFDLRVIAYDPHVDPGEICALGAKPCSLEDVFCRSDVVSLHAPNIEATRGMITGEHFAAMKRDATFINTARGQVVREREMLQVLRERPDLWACIDVTALKGAERCLLHTLPNVVATPHIAGSQDRECRRMGRYMYEELVRYVERGELRWEVTRDRLETMA